jgi:hypothetical protein
MTMSALYTFVKDQIVQTRAVSTKQYQVSEERRLISGAAARAMTALFRNLPAGLTQFSADALGHPETTYLRIDLRGPDGHISNRQALTLTRIGFVERDGERFAVDLDRGTDLGLVNAWSFRGSWSDHPEWMRYTSHPDHRRVWLDLLLHGHQSRGDMLLVLTGPLLAHKAVAAMARFAASVRAGGQAETAPLNALDRQQAKHRTAVAEIRARVEARVAAYPSLAALTAQHDALARQIAAMDWTYGEADRPSQSGYDSERRIKDGLAALALDDATALFLSQNTIYWEYLLGYVQRHPELMRLAA